MPVDLSGLPKNIRTKAEQLAQNIEFERLIEKGGNGYVLVGNNRVLDRRVAVKFYYWGNGDHAEPALLARLECENVLKVHHAESIDVEDAFFMTPFCELGDLDDAMFTHKFGPVEAVDVITQVAAGVSYLHGERYLHRDLKPSNVFCVDGGRFVIGDFGSVVVQNDQGFAQTVTRHSLLYRPPEELAESRSYEQGDVYQLGLTLFQLLGGKLPYDEVAWLTEKERTIYNALDDTERQLFAKGIIEKKIANGKIAEFSTLPCWVPKNLVSFVRRCCQIDRHSRFESAAALIAKLNNIRGRLPDWKIEEHPILHRHLKLYRVVKVRECYVIEKKVDGATAWRAERRLKPSSLEDAIHMVEGL